MVVMTMMIMVIKKTMVKKTEGGEIGISGGGGYSLQLSEEVK